MARSVRPEPGVGEHSGTLPEAGARNHRERWLMPAQSVGTAEDKGQGKVIWMDRLEVDMIAGASNAVAGYHRTIAPLRLSEQLGGPFDVAHCDMAANTTSPRSANTNALPSALPATVESQSGSRALFYRMVWTRTCPRFA